MKETSRKEWDKGDRWCYKSACWEDVVRVKGVKTVPAKERVELRNKKTGTEEGKRCVIA